MKDFRILMLICLIFVCLSSVSYSEKTGDEYYEGIVKKSTNAQKEGKGLDSIWYDEDLLMEDPDFYEDDSFESGGLFFKYMSLMDEQLEVINEQFCYDDLDAFDRHFISLGFDGYWHMNEYYHIGGLVSGGYKSVQGEEFGQTGSLLVTNAGIDQVFIIPLIVRQINLVVGSTIGVGWLNFKSEKNRLERWDWIVEPKAGIHIRFSEKYSLRLYGAYLFSEDFVYSTRGDFLSENIESELRFRNFTSGIVFEWNE